MPFPFSFTTSLAPVIAQASAETVRFPLVYQIACIILTALFLLTFSIARNPRSWRRLYQAKVQGPRDHFSVNRNKRIDEKLKRYGIIVAMVFLVADVSCFVLGFTYRHRADARELTPEEQSERQDLKRFKSGKSPGALF
ncbi:hypothetical protein FEM03_11000 [Phragmitibacter flavus]|uniref:Uncharacterized protein n=1 Tax=Phragmitibacter flavus TaxID=2576071 RepID=A0A5R8KEY7_9BACT|nr:hypothetical protein [Phragmitibacter flavus]TLD70827.1 hypothetical protein FEM03_11000 [Phragmitibacter flavus]